MIIYGWSFPRSSMSFFFPPIGKVNVFISSSRREQKDEEKKSISPTFPFLSRGKPDVDKDVFGRFKILNKDRITNCGRSEFYQLQKEWSKKKKKIEIRVPRALCWGFYFFLEYERNKNVFVGNHQFTYLIIKKKYIFKTSLSPSKQYGFNPKTFNTI